MSVNKYVIVHEDDAGPVNLAVYSDPEGLTKAKQFIQTQVSGGHDPQSYEVECFEGSKFKGTYNHEGKLVETREGGDVPPSMP